MEKSLETGADFRPSSTTSQLCDFGQVTASLSLRPVKYKIGLIMIFTIIVNIHYVLTTILRSPKYSMCFTSFNNTRLLWRFNEARWKWHESVLETLKYYAIIKLLLFSHSVMSDSLRPHGLQQARLPCPSLSPGVCSDSCPLSWCYPTISSSVAPFSSCPQSFTTSGSFPVSWLFTSGGRSIGASASASVLPVSTQGWFLLGWTVGKMQQTSTYQVLLLSYHS